MKMYQTLGIFALGACTQLPDSHVGVYAIRDADGIRALSLEHGGRFQFLMTGKKSMELGPILTGGSYIVVGDTMYFKSDVSLSPGRVQAAPIRGDSLFWVPGDPSQVFVRERPR